MDLAYDQIAADALPKDNEESSSDNKAEQSTLNEDLQEAYRAISTSAWGSRLGGFFGTVVKQVRATRSGHCVLLSHTLCDIGRVGLPRSLAGAHLPGCRCRQRRCRPPFYLDQPDTIIIPSYVAHRDRPQLLGQR
jgi:hypothetical protein